MNSKLLSIIAVFIGICLPMKMQAQGVATDITAPEFTFEGDNLVMTCETQGAIIYYSMSEFTDDDEAYDLADNMEVNEYTGTAYTEPIPVTKNVVIKAIAKMPQMQEGSDYKVLIYNYMSWTQLLEAIDYGTDVLNRAQNNPNVSDDLKEDLKWMLEDGQHFYQERGMMYDSYEAVMIRQHILEIAHQIEEIIGPAQTDPEPYAVLSQNNTVVTFYYDNQKAARGGMNINNSDLYFNSNSPSPYGSATTAVIDASFVNYRPTSTAYWFQRCSSLTSITGMENLKTEDVTNMNQMFIDCSRLTSLDVTGFNTQNVTNMGSMFRDCSSLTSLDVTGFNTQNVTNMNQMFIDCSRLSSLDVKGFNTQKVTDMSDMFQNCSALMRLDLSAFNTQNVTNMSGMFYGCSSLTSIDVTGFNTQKVTDMRYMFYGCSSLTSIDVMGFNTSNVTDMQWMFKGCSSLTSLDLSGFNTQNVTNMSDVFRECSGLTSLDLSGFNTQNVMYMDFMFYGCSGLTSLDVTGFNTQKVMYMDYMFNHCSSLTGLDVTGFNTQNVTTMGSMFSGCSGLTSLDVTGFNTQNVTTMHQMFMGCSGLTSLDVTGFNTQKVTNMNQMFSGCSGLTSLDLSGFNTQNVMTMNYMFSGCSDLTTIYAVSGWSTASVTEGDNMFRYCTNLKGGAGTHYDANHTDYTYAHIDGGTANPGYFTAAGAEPWKDIDAVVLTGKNGNYWYDVTGSNPNGEEAIIFTIPEIPEEGMEWEFNILGTFIQNQLAFTTEDGQAIDNIIGDVLFETKGNMVAIQDGKMLIYGSENEQGEIAMVDPYSGMIRIMGNEITLRLLNDPNTKFMALPLCVKAYYNNRDVAVKNGSFTVLVQSPKQVQEAEPYAVLSQNNTVLTFYYDEKKAERNGMSVGPFYDPDNSGWYEQRENITNVVFDASFANCTTLTSTCSWFCECSNLSTITGISNLKTDNVTDMSVMFWGCSGLTSLDISNFNTGNVVNMGDMFGGCSSLTSLDMRNFKTDKVANMNAMFYGCSGLTSLDVSNFKTDNVATMNMMFTNCSGLTSLDVSNFKTDKVTNMNGMFYGCSGLTSLDLSNFNTTNVTNMRSMFRGCSGLTSLDLSSFNTSNVTDMQEMFEECSGLTRLDVSHFNTAKVTNMFNMFLFCSSLTNLDLSSFNTSNVTSMLQMFLFCNSLAAIQAGSANIPAEEYARIGNPNLLVYVNEASLAPQGVQNVVINGEAKEIILTDVTEGNNNWHCPEPFGAWKISYTRNFKQQTEVGISRGWESIALPFTVQTITHETQGQIVPFGLQGKNFWLRGYSPDGLYNAATIEANKPYVISMPNNPTVYYAEYNLNGRVTFEATNTIVPATPDFEDMIITRDNITMAPIFITTPRDEMVYAINVGQPLDRYAEGSVFARELREVRPFEAATTHEPVNGARPNYIRIAAQPDYDVTGIVSIENGEWGMENGEWFGLDGRKLSGEPKTKGVYIQNGKKRIVR